MPIGCRPQAMDCRVLLLGWTNLQIQMLTSAGAELSQKDEQIQTKMLQLDLVWSQIPEPWAWIILQSIGVHCRSGGAQWTLPTFNWLSSAAAPVPANRDSANLCSGQPGKHMWPRNSRPLGKIRQMCDGPSGTARVEYGEWITRRRSSKPFCQSQMWEVFQRGFIGTEDEKPVAMLRQEHGGSVYRWQRDSGI